MHNIVIKDITKRNIHEIEEILQQNTCVLMGTMPLRFYTGRSSELSKFLTYCDAYKYSISFYKTKIGNQQKVFFIFWNSCCCPLIEYFDNYEDFDELAENIFQQCIKFAEGKLSLTPCKFIKQNNITKQVETSEWFEPKLPF
jgi:hypothetical protein